MEMRSETHNEWTESSTDVSGRPSGSGGGDGGGGGLYTDNSHSASQLQTRSQSRDDNIHQATAAQQRSSRGQRPSGRHIPDASPPPRLPAEYAALKKKEPSPRHAPTRGAVKKAAVSSEDDAAEENVEEEEEEYDEEGNPSQPLYEDNTNDEEGEEAEEGEYDDEAEEEDDEDDWESADEEDEEEQEGEDVGFSGARALQDEFDESRGKSSQPSVSTVVKYPFSLHTSKPAPQAHTSFGAAFAASAFRRATPQPRAGYSMGYTAQDGVSSEEAPKPSPSQPQQDEEAAAAVAAAPPPAAAATSAFGFGFGAVSNSSVMGVSGGDVKKTAFGASPFPTHGFGAFGAASTAAASATTTTTTGEVGTAGSTAVASPFSLSSPFPMTAAVPVVAEALKTIPEVKLAISSPTTATESKPENEAAAAVVTMGSSATDKKEGAAFAFPTSSSSVLSGAAPVQVEDEGSVVKPAFGGDGSAPGLPYPLPTSKLVSAMHEGFSGLALSDATTNEAANAPSVKPPSSSQFTAFAFSTVPNSTPAFGAGGGAATRPFGVLGGPTDKATNAFVTPFAFPTAGAAAATVAAAPVPTEKKPNCSPLPGGFSDRPFGVVPGPPSPLPTAVGGWNTAAPAGDAPSAPLTVASKTAPFPLFGFQPARKDAPAAWGSGEAPQAFGGAAVGGAPAAVFGGFASLAGGTSNTPSNGAAEAAAKTDTNAGDTPLQAQQEPSMKAEPPSVSSSPRSPMRPTVAIAERQEEAEEGDNNNNNNSDDNNNNGDGDASSVCSTSVDYSAMVASPVVLPPEDEEEGEEGEEKCAKEAKDSSSTNCGGDGNAGGHTTTDVAGLFLGQKTEPHTTATNTEVSQLSYHSCVEARDAATTVDLTTKKEEEESCSRESEARKEKTARLAATGPCPAVEAILSSVTDTGSEAALLTSACEREEKEEERKGETDGSQPLNGAPSESSPLQPPTPQPVEHQVSTVTATSSVAAAATAVVDSLHALRDDVKAAQTADVSPPSPDVQRAGRTLLPRPQAPQLPPVVVKVTIKQLYNSTQQNHQWMAATTTTTTTTTMRKGNKEDAAALRSSRGAPEVALYCRPLLIHLPNPPLHTSAMSAAGESAVLRSTVMFLRFVFGWLLPAVVRLLVHAVVAVGLVVLAVVVADGVWYECPMVRVWVAEATAYLQQLPIEQYKTMLLELWESRK